MPDHTTIPYDVLIVDDQTNPSSWPHIVAANLRLEGFNVEQARSPRDVELILKRREFDIFIIDVDLHARQTGIDVTAHLRQQGYVQPIILATGESDYMRKPIEEYASAFSLGPVTFHIKNAEDDEGIIALVHDATTRVDQFRRALRLMREAGLLESTLTIGEETYSVEDLLHSNTAANNLSKNLREALHALLIRILSEKASG